MRNRAEKVTSGANEAEFRFGALGTRFTPSGHGAKMTSQDRDYFMLRARQEDEAAQLSTSRTVRCRHEELGWAYRMRLQFAGREDLVVLRGPLIASS
mgnify:CR=1 FL=1